MTIPETSAKTESTGTLFQALQSAGVEPDLAYRADEEVRNRAGQNVIAVISAKMDALNKEHGAQMEAWATALETKIEIQGTELHAKIDARTEELRARMEAQATKTRGSIDAQAVQIASNGTRIDDLRVVMLRVIWLLILLLAVPIFGKLYITLSSP